MNINEMVSVRNKPWAHVGVSVDHAMSVHEALEMAHANFNVISTPVFDVNGREIPFCRANMREDTGAVLATVGPRYQIFQHEDALGGFVDALIGHIEIDTVILAKGGAELVLLARMPERQMVGDTYTPYICFVNTHDGSRALTVCMTPLRIICNNMINMMVRNCRRAWCTAHKGDLQGKLGQARQALGLTAAYLNGLEDMADRLANEPFYEADVFQTLDQMIVLPENATERMKRTAAETKDEIMQNLYAPDLRQFVDTKWAFLQAVADYVDHSEPKRKTANWQENRFLSVMHGHPLFDKAVELVA